MPRPTDTRAVLARQITAALHDVAAETAVWTASLRDDDSLRRLATDLRYAAEKVEALRNLSLSPEAR
jgi:hypothetical protein